MPTITTPKVAKSSIPKPDLNALRTAALARGTAEQAKFGNVPKPGQTYNPQQALQQRTGTQPVSAFVNKPVEVKQPVKSEQTGAVIQPQPTQGQQTVDETGNVTVNIPPSQVTPTPISTVNATVEDAKKDLEPGFDQWKADQDKLTELTDEQKDEKVASYEQLYNRQIERLDQLKQMMEEMTLQKNQLITSSSQIQRDEINASYEANKELMKVAQERADMLQRQVLAEKEAQFDRKKMNEANMLAIIGGFGSMAGNKMVLDSIDKGNQAITDLKTQYSLDDREMTAKMVKLNQDYATDKNKIEQWAQESIVKNYENLQSYIESIINKEDMADKDKVQAINAAKDQYNNRIYEINSNVINARYELSRDIISRSDQLRKENEARIEKTRQNKIEDIENARKSLALLAENYSIENFDTLPDNVKDDIAKLEEQADLPVGFTAQAIKQFKETNKVADTQIMSQVDNQGNWTIVAINKKTGQKIAQETILKAGKATSIGGTAGYFESGGNRLSKAIFTTGRFINEPVGQETINGVVVKAKASIIKKAKAADEAMKSAGLEGLKIRGSFRTNDEQSNVPNEDTNAQPGESFHEAGQAIDVDNWKEAEPYLRAQGFANDLSWDPGHFSIGETNKTTEKVDEYATELESPNNTTTIEEEPGMVDRIKNYFSSSEEEPSDKNYDTEFSDYQ
jgi:hypothetical protein